MTVLGDYYATADMEGIVGLRRALSTTERAQMKIEVRAITPKKGALEKQVWEALKRQHVEWLEGRLKDIECSEHHECPRVTVTGSLKNPKFKIEGCCQKLVDRATEALK